MRQKTSGEPSELADKLFPSAESDHLQDSILSIPPEQRRLHTETYDFSVSTIRDYLSDDRMYVPEFQRRYVWSDSQASRLVESLIIQCPIPVIYLNQESDERLSVIDGNQRLNSLKRYIENIFPLKGLTAYPELEGLYFHQLDARFQRHILNRTLRCIVILKGTHPQVKFDVFERLNTGSVKLTAQELRHGIYYGPLMELIGSLAKDKVWASLFPGANTPDKRMKSEEFILRFFAFHNNHSRYEKPLTAFLNDFAEANRNLDENGLKALADLFKRVVQQVKRIYGNIAFKIFDSTMTVKSQFNVALFDAEMLSVSKNLAKAELLTDSQCKDWIKQVQLLFEDSKFSKAIGRATSDEQSVAERINTLVAKFASQ